MKLTSLVLAASATTAVLASHIESNSHSQQLERREPTFGLLEGVLGGLLGGGHAHSSRYPSRNWKCNGRGTDGYDYDIYGSTRPHHIPYGWKYYGVSIGWAPSPQWSCSSKYKFSSEFLSKIHLVTWFKPSSAWIKHNAGINLGVSVPSWWGLLPSSNWKCSGKGNDGFSLDVHGQGPPSWVPSSGWAYFGSNFGWMPTSSFKCDADFKIPSQFLPKAHLCSWWSPSTAWKNHNIGIELGISVPSHWHWSTLPSADWQCDGGGRDGLEIDFKGNGRPSWAPSGWLWWGSSIGWGPSASFQCDADFKIPSQIVGNLHKFHWWTPSLAWKHKHAGINLNFTIPSFWNWNPRPSADWKCNGTGKDGVEIDIHGNGPPSWVPSSGWYYYGVEVGWQPSASWSCGSSWSIPSQWQDSCDKASWWTPPKPWVSKHRGHGWKWSFSPPKNWGCDVPATITQSSSSVHATTTSVKPSSKPATSSKVTTSVHKTTTSVKATTTSKAQHSTSVAKSTTTSKPKPHTSSQPKPTSNGGNNTVTVTITKTVSVPAPTGGSGSGSCPCEAQPYRLARREKSRLD